MLALWHGATLHSLEEQKGKAVAEAAEAKWDARQDGAKRGDAEDYSAYDAYGFVDGVFAGEHPGKEDRTAYAEYPEPSDTFEAARKSKVRGATTGIHQLCAPNSVVDAHTGSRARTR